MRRLGLALVASALVCCQPGPDNGRELPLVPDEVLIVPGERVGALVLGQSTPDSIATYVDREQFATEQGLDLQFDRKHRLSIITVFSPRFSTREGLRVGSLASEVEATLGSPRSRSGEEKHGKFKVPALIYDDIGFVTQDERVVAIGIPGE